MYLYLSPCTQRIHTKNNAHTHTTRHTRQHTQHVLLAHLHLHPTSTHHPCGTACVPIRALRDAAGLRRTPTGGSGAPGQLGCRNNALLNHLRTRFSPNRVRWNRRGRADNNLYTLYPIPILPSILYTLYSIPYTHFTLYTLYSILYTLYPSIPSIPSCPLYPLCCTLYTLYTLYNLYLYPL